MLNLIKAILKVYIKKGYVDFYMIRKKTDKNLNLVDFIKKYYIRNNKILKRKVLDENLVSYFTPTYSSNKNSENFYNYCRYQIMKFKPWDDLKYFYPTEIDLEKKKRYIDDFNLFFISSSLMNDSPIDLDDNLQDISEENNTKTKKQLNRFCQKI